MNESAPSAGFWRRKPECGVVLALALLLALGILVNDRVVANGRELTVLNRTGAPAKLTLPHGEVLELEHGQLRAVAIGEGSHRVLIELEGAPARPVEVAISGNVLERLLGGRVYLLNLGAAAPIVWEETIYGPTEKAPPATPGRVVLGEVLVFERVDEVFAPFPDNAPEGPRVRIGLAPGEPTRLLGALAPAERSALGALRYAEHHLRRTPDDDELLGLYARAARGDHAQAGAAFLASRLEERPARVLWHRAHQDLRRAAGDVEALRQEYSAACAREPGSSALLALAARLEDDPDRALAGYRRALVVNANDPFAHYGVAVHLFRRADYLGARAEIDAACRARPRDANFANLRFLVRCGAGEWALLVGELDQALKAAPTSFPVLQRYLEALVASGQSDRAREACQRYRQRLSDRDDPRQLALLASLSLDGLEGRWEELRRGLPQLKDEVLRVRLAFQAAIGGGKPAEAGEPRGPSETLQLALAWSLHPASETEAKASRERLLLLLTKSEGAWRALGPLLQSGEHEALSKLALSPDDKACALYLLAAGLPGEARDPYTKLAARYDLGRRHPHALLARASEQLSPR